MKLLEPKKVNIFIFYRVTFPEVLNLNAFIPSGEKTEEKLEETIIRCDDSSTTDSGSALDDDSCQIADATATSSSYNDDYPDNDEGIDVSDGTTRTNNHENRKNVEEVEEPGPYIYELFSIMIHSGSASGGHYYAYIKDFRTDEWFCFNDQSVSRVSITFLHSIFNPLI